jgi:CheY-like chemotaxis protein
MFEDGLQKIFSGFTSFEALFAGVAPTPGLFGDGRKLYEVEHRVVPSAPVATPSKVPPSGAKTVLVIEDDPDQRHVIEAVFRTEGYQVVGAPDGADGLQILSVRPVDVVVCDLMMPGMNGIEFVKKVRATDALKKLPVLMLTATHNPECEYQLLDLGADDYCEKHVKRKILLKRVERLLERRAGNPVEHLLKVD